MEVSLPGLSESGRLRNRARLRPFNRLEMNVLLVILMLASILFRCSEEETSERVAVCAWWTAIKGAPRN